MKENYVINYTNAKTSLTDKRTFTPRFFSTQYTRLWN